MIHPAPSMSRVIAALSVVLGLLLVAPSRGRAQQMSGDEVVEKMTQLNKEAVVAYQAGKFEDARKMLKQALDMAATAGLQTHPITARTHIHFGIVVIGGFKQKDLGLKQFKKAIEIQADIGLTKALVTPELQEAFAEAKKGVEKGPDKPAAATPPPEGKPPATPATPPPEAKPAKPAEPDVPASGIIHEAVTEGRQGSAISVSVTVKDELEFEKLILAYRPDGATDFLGREMKEEAEGRYSAEIPPGATSGGAVAYYIEAEDANGSPVAARGSVDNPMVIHLGGVGAPVAEEKDEDEDDEDEDDDEPDYKYFVGLMGGTGFGWATGEGDTNADRTIKSGVAMSTAVQIAPEFGYWWTSSLMLSAQIRYQYVTGTNDIYIPSGGGFQVFHTANYALAVFAKATWFYGEDKLHPFFSLGAGVGRIRHVVDFGLADATLRTCGPDRNANCVDTIGAGPILLGPGGGLMYDITDTASLVLQLNSVVGFPTFTFHLDTNLGVAVNF